MSERIGQYNKYTDLKFELSSFYQLTQKEISKIKLFIDKTLCNIIALEFFYGDISTGIFHNDNIKEDQLKIEKNSNLVIKEIDLASNKYSKIESIFVENKIIKLLFCSSSPEEKIGFNIVECTPDFSEEKIQILLPTLKIENIIISDRKLVSFEFSFNEDGLSFIKPEFHKPEPLTEFSPIKENMENKDIEAISNNKYFKSELYGKKFGDSKEYQLNQEIIIECYKLYKLFFYHDGHIMMGIEMHFKKGEKTLIEKFGKIDGIKTGLELNVDYGEKIQQIILRTGDMMDGIMVKTNKGQLIIAGGNGGGEHFYNLEDENKKLELIGMEGSFSGTIHQINLILKEIP